MRLPTPAAGTIPHILLNLSNHLPLINSSDRRHTASRVEYVFQFKCSISCRVRLEHSLTTCGCDSRELGVWQLHCFDHVVGSPSNDDLNARLKERLKAFPRARHDRQPASACFDQTTRRTVAHPCHGAARYIKR